MTFYTLFTLLAFAVGAVVGLSTAYLIDYLSED